MTEEQWNTLNAALSAGKIATQALLDARAAQGWEAPHLNDWLEENEKARALMIEIGSKIEMACEATWN
jgi:hypothetical protein